MNRGITRRIRNSFYRNPTNEYSPVVPRKISRLDFCRSIFVCVSEKLFTSRYFVGENKLDFHRRLTQHLEFRLSLKELFSEDISIF